MLNIVIPMAGHGSRFRNAGFDLPKPLIPVHGIPMIRLVIENLKPSQSHRFIFLCLQEHLDTYDLEKTLRSWVEDPVIVSVNEVTQGAACTVLLAKAYIDSDDPMMIANSDQWVDVNIDDYIASMGNSDGLIMTMKADDPKWSFVRLDDERKITEVVEKVVVSDEATVGIYDFKSGKDFVRSAEEMIEADLRVNGEFYVAPVYNQLIRAGKEIGFYNIGSEGAGMYGIGLPEDLAKFEALPVSLRAVQGLA